VLDQVIINTNDNAEALSLAEFHLKGIAAVIGSSWVTSLPEPVMGISVQPTSMAKAMSKMKILELHNWKPPM